MVSKENCNLSCEHLTPCASVASNAPKIEKSGCSKHLKTYLALQVFANTRWSPAFNIVSTWKFREKPLFLRFPSAPLPKIQPISFKERDFFLLPVCHLFSVVLFCGRWRRRQVTCHRFTSWKNKRILLHLRSSTQLNSKKISLHSKRFRMNSFSAVWPRADWSEMGMVDWLLSLQFTRRKNAENRFVLEPLATQAITKFEGYHVILLFQSFVAELCNLIIIKNSCRVPYPIRTHIYFSTNQRQTETKRNCATERID